MHIVVVGLNHRTAPVEVREKFTFAQGDLPQALQELKNTKSVLECVVVATCNRTEIYAVVDKLPRYSHYIRGFIEKWFNVPREQFRDYLYSYEEDKAIRHLFKVTAGLNSMIIGETQILGQVKDAFFLAQQNQATGTMFNELFKQAITTAKRAHYETSIAENAVSVSYAAVELGKRIFGSYANKKVLIVGAGKMGELTLKHLRVSGLKQLYVVNRTFSKALELAESAGGTACQFERLAELLTEVDVVITSTGATEFVLTHKMLQTVVAQRKSRPLFMMDIAVPRDADPKIGELANVFLYDIDDLEALVESNMEERQKEAAKIELMIDNEMIAFEMWQRTLGVAPLIQALHQKASSVHEETMDSLLKKLPELDERQIKVIRKLTKSIVNQMLRDPIVRIKEMSAQRHGDEALDYFTQIFALEEILAEQHMESDEKQHNPSKENEQSSTTVQGWQREMTTLALP
ncbi:glutamyl-tRNA reductase [Paenibacillus sp. N1-5-1-14]|uniref:glutamyl-tRNA reductase n=1 Tax=Paenibacillus radicibacter TaxID=2972488 RepID=UPI0021597502|nr:glutamyl-tRNA reductase [Paenibacillus radicibacter]MCR8644179.1 glutamyl-tRNA reductase [Paenibacillus radicibacter]